MMLGKRGMRRVHLVEAQDDMGGTMRWIPQLPGLGEWARVVNYRQIQIDKLKNVEFIPNTKLAAKGVAEYGAEIVVVATGSYWATDGLNGCLARRDPRRRREPAVAGDARPAHGRGQAARRATASSSSTTTATSWASRSPRSSRARARRSR